MHHKLLLVLVFSALLFSIPSIAQPEKTQGTNYEEGVQLRLDEYFDYMIRSEWDSLMEMIYPKLFNIAPKEMMVETFKQISSQEMKITFDLPEVQSISAPFEYQEEVFVKVDYLASMQMQMLFEDLQAPEFIEMLTATFEAQYGKENVDYDPKTFTFALKVDSEMFAIAPSGSQIWTFIENKAEQVDIINQLIPEEVRNSF